MPATRDGRVSTMLPAIEVAGEAISARSGVAKDMRGLGVAIYQEHLIGSAFLSKEWIL